MGRTCPYCKTADVEALRAYPRTVCYNCRYYQEASEARRKEEEERELLKRFRCIPWDWDAHDGWQGGCELR